MATLEQLEALETIMERGIAAATVLPLRQAHHPARVKTYSAYFPKDGRLLFSCADCDKAKPTMGDGMTALDDRDHIHSAPYAEAQLRKQCVEGTDRYAVGPGPQAICRRRGRQHEGALQLPRSRSPPPPTSPSAHRKSRPPLPSPRGARRPAPRGGRDGAIYVKGKCG